MTKQIMTGHSGVTGGGIQNKATWFSWEPQYLSKCKTTDHLSTEDIWLHFAAHNTEWKQGQHQTTALCYHANNTGYMSALT